jgi:hypothetical protein
MSPEQELNDLYRMREVFKRGRLFEQFIARLLEGQGFDVTINPKTAKPRQTDLCASRDGVFFIIEAKWQKKPVHVGGVSSAQERLRKTPSDVFACMFSMSDYTAPAKEYSVDNRSPEVVLFAENEILGLAFGALEFSELLAKKRDEIRTHAKVWFSSWTRTGWERHLFPRLGPEILNVEGQSLKWLLSGTQGDDVIFAREMLDLGSYSQSACSLRLQVGIRTADDLSKLLRSLKTHLRLEGADSFAIHQRSAGWYGSGADNFVLAARQWEQRYKQLDWPSYHHSESLAYFDKLDGGGLMSLTLQQRVGDNSFFHAGFVEILTSGIPIDTAAVQRLCAKTNNCGARYEIVADKPIQTYRFSPFVEVKPIGLVVDPREGGWACGFIARNPFYQHGTCASFGGSSLAESPIRFLSNTELIFCRLKSWHGTARIMDKYEIEYVEGCWVENIPVLYIACDWR